jgi:hypothetical protein
MKKNALRTFAVLTLASLAACTGAPPSPSNPEKPQVVKQRGNAVTVEAENPLPK